MRTIRNRLTYANVMSTLAVVLVIGGGTAYAVATIGSDDVIDESLRGVDVKDRSLRGADLGVRVRSARQVEDEPCGQGPDFEICAALLGFDVPRPQRLLLVGSGEWAGATDSAVNRGECRFAVGPLLRFGEREFGEVNSSPSAPFNFAMNSVSIKLGEGSYDVGIECRRTSGDSSAIVVRNTELSVAALGDG